MELIKYKKSHAKIAMEYLAYMPCEMDLADLQQTLHQYEQDSGWQLYLAMDGTGYIGAIGIELSEHTFCVHHISVHPSLRNEGIGNTMVEKVQQLHEPLALCTAEATKDFLAKCWDKQQAF